MGVVKFLIIDVLFILTWNSCVSALCDDNFAESADATGTRATNSLKLVFVISRHGNRGGSADYPLDPYPLNDTTYWPYGALALTPHGRVQAYNLGVKLRTLYNGFLPEMFRSDDIYATSDLYERVIMTAELVLAGLYPPRGSQVWNKDIKWQPIAVYTNSSDRTQGLDDGHCPRYTQMFKKTESAFVENNVAAMFALTSIVRQATGDTATTIDLENLYDKLISEDTEGYKLPSWTEHLYPEPLADFFREGFLAQYGETDEIVRLLVGNMLDEMIVSMKNKINGSLRPDRKMIYYSGHDDTVLSLQVALGVPKSNIGIVKVGSALIVELHQNCETGESLVQVLYIDGSSPDLEPVTLSLPRCGHPCHFNTFLNTTDRFANVDYEKECKL